MRALKDFDPERFRGRYKFSAEDATRLLLDSARQAERVPRTASDAF
jgi:hypothetical protein